MATRFDFFYDNKIDVGTFTNIAYFTLHKEGVNENGFPIKQEDEVYKKYARVEQDRYRAKDSNNNDVFQTRYIFTIRYFKEFVEDMTVVWNGNEYEIYDIENVNSNNTFLRVNCTKKVRS